MKRTILLLLGSVCILGACAWVAAADDAITPEPPVKDWLFIRGDTNIDGAVDIGDVIDSLNFLFGFPSGEVAHCLAAHDANDDEVVDLADPVYIAEYLFNGGPPPPHPFPSCGFDTTHGAAGPLPCNDYYLCATRPRL
jgi:hypothetical protein